MRGWAGRGLAGPRGQAYVCHLQGGGRTALPAQDGGPAGHALGVASSHPAVSSGPPHSPGPQTVDLIPVFSSTGTRLMAPSMCWVNTSQSRSKRPKAKSSDTWGHGGKLPCASRPLEPGSVRWRRSRRSRLSPSTPPPPEALSAPPSCLDPGPPALPWNGLLLVALLQPICPSQTRPFLALEPPKTPCDSVSHKALHKQALPMSATDPQPSWPSFGSSRKASLV